MTGAPIHFGEKMESASVPVLLRNSSIYLAALHLLKKFCAGEFQVATSLLGAHLGAQRIHGVEITAEMALVGARMTPLGAGVGAAAPGQGRGNFLMPLRTRVPIDTGHEAGCGRRSLTVRPLAFSSSRLGMHQAWLPHTAGFRASLPAVSSTSKAPTARVCFVRARMCVCRKQ